MCKSVRKIWNPSEDQLLIEMFNKYKQDSIVVYKTYRKLGRTEHAVTVRMHRLRNSGLIGSSAKSRVMRKAAEPRVTESTVRRTVSEIVVQKANDELVILASYIVGKMTKEQKQQLILSLIA
jgi:hypothetical protein